MLRFRVAGRALWCYLGDGVWTHPLLFRYPRWTVHGANAALWLFARRAAGAVAGLWAIRQRLGRGPLAAALFFVATLGPALGFLNISPPRFSFVADHFQYLASIGPIVLGVGAIAGLSRLGGTSARVLAAVALVLLGSLTWKQARDYENLETLWTATVNGNPRAHVAHNNLGAEKLRLSMRATLASESGRLLQEAQEHFEVAAEIDYPEAHNNLGIVLHRRGRLAEAVEHYRTALRLSPNFADAVNNLGITMAELGRIDEAMRHFAEAVRRSPSMASARFNLAELLTRAGKPEQALPHLDELVRLDPQNASFRRLRDRLRAQLNTAPVP